MTQKLIVTFEKEINNCLVQLHLPVGASWADAFACIEEILNKVRELSVQNTQEKSAEQPQENEQSSPEVETKVEEPVNPE